MRKIRFGRVKVDLSEHVKEEGNIASAKVLFREEKNI